MLNKRIAPFSFFLLLIACLATSVAFAQSQKSVRFGAHSSYNRVVFDQTAPAKFTVEKKGSAVVITFNKAFEFLLNKFHKPSYPFITRIESKVHGHKTIVTIHTAGPPRYRQFSNEGSAVVDILKPAPLQKTSAQKAVATPPSPTARPAARIATLTEKEAKEAVRKRQVDQHPIAPLKKPATPPSRLTGEGFDGPPVPVQITEEGATFRVEFVWGDQTSAAIFKRLNTVWVVFDTVGKFVQQAPGKVQNKFANNMTQVIADGGSAIRMSIIPGVNPHISRNEKSWVVTFKPSSFAPEISIDPLPQPTYGGGPRVFIPVEKPGKVVQLKDDQVGDTLFVGTLSALGRGMDKSLQFVDFTTLKSAQGFPVQVVADGTYMQNVGNGFAIANTRGLKLSPTGENAANLSVRIFRFEDWLHESDGHFVDAEKNLFLQLSQANENQAPGIYYDLAKFYFAHGFTKEAIALLDMLARKDPDMVKKPEFIALQGAGQFMLRDYDKAYNFLLNPKLDAFGEVALWRGALAAKHGKWAAAQQQFAEAGSIPAIWPLEIRRVLSLLAMKTALAQKDFKSAEKILTGFERSLNQRDFDRFSTDGFFQLYRGGILKESGNIAGALDQWKKAAKSDNQFIRTRARYNLIKAQLEAEKISPDDAIIQLERLRFAWRTSRAKRPKRQHPVLEERFEFDVLELLGRTYAKNGHYRKALTTLRTVITDFSDVRDTSALATLMTDTFTDLFYKDTADTLSPLKAVALFDEFRELTPVDEQGDAMIEKLADRLVRVDLLSRAAELLEFQVEFRVKGLEKARISTRLALIYNLNEEYDKALKVLRSSEMVGLSENLERQRRILKARALFETKHPKEAIATLFNDFSHNADLLRADIYWRTQNWEMAGRVLNRLAGQAEEKVRASPSEENKNDLREAVLNWSVTLALSKKDKKVEELRRRYAHFMNGSSYEDLFNLITDTTIDTTSDAGIKKFSELSRRFSKIDMFERFMNAYRQQLSNGKLSDIN